MCIKTAPRNLDWSTVLSRRSRWQRSQRDHCRSVDRTHRFFNNGIRVNVNANAATAAAVGRPPAGSSHHMCVAWKWKSINHFMAGLAWVQFQVYWGIICLCSVRLRYWNVIKMQMLQACFKGHSPGGGGHGRPSRRSSRRRRLSARPLAFLQIHQRIRLVAGGGRWSPKMMMMLIEGFATSEWKGCDCNCSRRDDTKSPMRIVGGLFGRFKTDTDFCCNLTSYL